MKFEIGNMYRTRDGRKAQIFMLDNGCGYMLGAINSHYDKWNEYSWHNDGMFMEGKTICEQDLVSEWREPIRYSVEMWGNKWHPNDFNLSGDAANRLFGNGRVCNGTKSPLCNIKYRIDVTEIPE